MKLLVINMEGNKEKGKPGVTKEIKMFQEGKIIEVRKRKKNMSP